MSNYNHFWPSKITLRRSSTTVIFKSKWHKCVSKTSNSANQRIMHLATSSLAAVSPTIVTLLRVSQSKNSEWAWTKSTNQMRIWRSKPCSTSNPEQTKGTTVFQAIKWCLWMVRPNCFVQDRSVAYALPSRSHRLLTTLSLIYHLWSQLSFQLLGSKSKKSASQLRSAMRKT